MEPINFPPASVTAEQSRTTSDGLRLAVRVRHPTGSPTLLFAHGLGQTRGAWNGAAAALADVGYRCVSYDSRGHGDSDRLPGGDYHFEQLADDLLQIACDQPAPPVLIGASMGGLLGLALAGEVRPCPFRALVLVDITPRWETHGVERIMTFMQAHPNGFASYAEAVIEVTRYLPQRRERKREDQLRPLLNEGADGRLRWHWDTALLGAVARESERYQPRLLAAAAGIEIPVLLLSGALSDVVSASTANEFLGLVKHARHVTVAGAAHMLAGDANDAFTREVATFVQSLPTARNVAEQQLSRP